MVHIIIIIIIMIMIMMDTKNQFSHSLQVYRFMNMNFIHEPYGGLMK